MIYPAMALPVSTKPCFRTWKAQPQELVDAFLWQAAGEQRIRAVPEAVRHAVIQEFDR
jgi:hypothetical protein